MSENPAISVIMSVYNDGDCVGKAIESILSQSFSDFEFIIIDDGSTDFTPDILKDFSEKDARIQVHTQDNTGLTKALNKGLSLAKGNYIARQDADDISYPQRFEKQVVVLENNQDVVVVGSGADDLYPDGFTARWGHYSEDELQKVVFLKTPFPHASAMMRADICKKLSGYDESFKTSQDMELWMRMAKEGKLAMIEEPLMRRYVGNDSITVKRRWPQFFDAMRARLKHNTNPFPALYHSFRSLAIALVPYSILKKWRSHKDSKSQGARQLS